MKVNKYNYTALGDIFDITALSVEDMATLSEILKSGINCNPIQNTDSGKKFIDLIAEIEVLIKETKKVNK